MVSDDLHQIDRSIIEAAGRGWSISEEELDLIVRHVARRGFPPEENARVRLWMDGKRWGGRTLRSGVGNRTTQLAAHYLKHVERDREWPDGTSPAEYVESIRRVVLDPTSGVALNEYQGAVSLAFLRSSGSSRGPNGREWVLVQYRVRIGRWVTAFQPELGLDELKQPDWSDVIWLRGPR